MGYGTGDVFIYLSSSRGVDRTGSYITNSTFSFGKYKNPDRTGVGRLKALNDEVLGAGRSIVHGCNTNQLLIVLPLAGGVEYQHKDSNGHVEAGQIALVPVTAGEVTFRNSYSEDVNYLHLWMDEDSQSSTNEFSMSRNKLSEIGVFGGIKTSIGEYDGRVDDTFVQRASASGIFVFCIEGAFEVQHRLLERRDGLYLTGDQKVEFEALSNLAILLVLEV